MVSSLPERFTDEVLKKVRVMGGGMAGQQLEGTTRVTEAMEQEEAVFMQDK